MKTKIKKSEMKMLIHLCTKELHFSFKGKMYKQFIEVVMENPLGPVIANIFMVELENNHGLLINRTGKVKTSLQKLT